MQEQLLGYLLGALDADEQHEVESRLKVDPLWQAEIARLRAHLLPLDADREHHSPPAGLAARACEFAFAQRTPEVSLASGSLERELSGSRTGRWSLADLIVACGICAAAVLLFFPAIAHSRFAAELAQCQNNLRELGISLAAYDERHLQMPFPDARSPMRLVGMYAPILVEDGYITESERFVCPRSALAQCPQRFHVACRSDLNRATTPVSLQHDLGGSYGYSLGYLQDGQYRPMRNLHRPMFAIMADSPSKHLRELRSANHGGQGQNVLFENGRVQYLVTVSLGDESTDNFFLSDRGCVEPGRHPNDAVIAASDTPVPDMMLVDQ